MMSQRTGIMPEVSRLGSTLLSLALAGVLVLAAHADLALMAAAVLLVQVLVAIAPPLTTSTGEVGVSREHQDPREGEGQESGSES